MKSTLFIFTFLGLLLPIQAHLEEAKQLTLMDAIGLTLMNERQVEVLKLDYVREEGVLIETAEPFDWNLETEASHIYTNDAQDFSNGRRSDLDANKAEASLFFSKKTRPGTLFTLRGDTTFSDNAVERLIFTNRRGSFGKLAFRVEQPLLRNFRCGIEAMRECAEKYTLESVFYNTLQFISERILDTQRDYWDLAAIYKIVAIQEEAVARAEKLVLDSEELARWEEIPRSDLAQVRAQVARERARLTEDKQNVIRFSQRLSFLTGTHLNLTDGLVYNWELDAFPIVNQEWKGAEAVLPSVLSDALRYRFDLQSLEKRRKASEYLVKGEYNGLCPELDLFAEASSQNFQTGKTARTVPKAWNRNKDQVDLAMGVQFSIPFCNSGARGRYRQEKAELCRRQLEWERGRDLSITEVRETFARQLTLAERISLTEAEVYENNLLVESELRKLKGGASTIFFVIDFQNRLTESQRSLTVLKKEYAQNQALLLFQTGWLLRSGRCLRDFYVSTQEVPWLQMTKN